MADTEFELAVAQMRKTIDDAIAGAIGAFQTVASASNLMTNEPKADHPESAHTG